MVLYNEKGVKVSYKEENHIGKDSTSGNVYLLDDDTCLKYFKNSKDINLDVIRLINSLKLPNFYEIKEPLFDKKGVFSGYTMKYYPVFTFDILKMPTEYTIESFSNLYKAIQKLTNCGIYISDLHEDNVILTKDGIIVIDTDLYSKSILFTKDELRRKNNKALLYLFKRLYLEALESYFISYEEKESFTTIINSLFEETKTLSNLEKLSDYDYPIDYIKEKVRRRNHVI